MTIIFNQRVKHDRMEFFPGVPVDVGSAASYFVACGWASSTSEAPVAIYEVEIDPEARVAETGKLVIDNG